MPPHFPPNPLPAKHDDQMVIKLDIWVQPNIWCHLQSEHTKHSRFLLFSKPRHLRENKTLAFNRLF